MAAPARLAQSAGAELAALFVEDINLLRLADLPFAQEIGMASATMRRLVAADVERTLKRQAEVLRGALAEMAHAASLDWTFATARGHHLPPGHDALTGPAQTPVDRVAHQYHAVAVWRGLR